MNRIIRVRIRISIRVTIEDQDQDLDKDTDKDIRWAESYAKKRFGAHEAMSCDESYVNKRIWSTSGSPMWRIICK